MFNFIFPIVSCSSCLCEFFGVKFIRVFSLKLLLLINFTRHVSCFLESLCLGISPSDLKVPREKAPVQMMDLSNDLEDSISLFLLYLTLVRDPESEAKNFFTVYILHSTEYRRCLFGGLWVSRPASDKKIWRTKKKKQHEKSKEME